LGVMRSAGNWIAPFLVPLGLPLRRRFRDEIARYPDLRKAAGNMDRLFRACITLACQRSLDDLLMLRFPAAILVQNCTIRGREHLAQALKQNRGVILAGGHFLANRLAKRCMESEGWPVMSVRNLDYDDPKLGYWGKRHLQNRYYGLLHRVIGDEVGVHDRECVLKILARLRGGGIVYLHIDYPFSQKIQDVAFLGAVHPFAAGFLQVARIAGSPIIPVVCLGNSRGLSIGFLPPLSLKTRSEEELLEDLVRILESQVLAHPEQWEHTLRL
jgi:lauroyl/myristoyl acyltransferase